MVQPQSLLLTLGFVMSRADTVSGPCPRTGGYSVHTPFYPQSPVWLIFVNMFPDFHVHNFSLPWDLHGRGINGLLPTSPKSVPVLSGLSLTHLSLTEVQLACAEAGMCRGCRVGRCSFWVGQCGQEGQFAGFEPQTVAAKQSPQGPTNPPGPHTDARETNAYFTSS